MKKWCLNCKKEFTPARKRSEVKFCEIRCYQAYRSKKTKIDWGQFLFDMCQIMVPILLIAFIVYKITPKVDYKRELKKEMEDVKRIQYSSCDDEDDNEEDIKYLNAILSKRR